MPARSQSFPSEIDHAVVVFSDETYTPGSADNVRPYDTVYRLDGPAVSSVLCVAVTHGASELASCVLLANGGGVAINERTAIVTPGLCRIAVANHVVALTLPSLAMAWATSIPYSFSFALYRVPGSADLIVHGETDIARIDEDGRVVWSAGGADIFTGPFAVTDTEVAAEDFDGRPYRLSIRDGRSAS